MKPPVIVIGIGELGGVFAHGLLRCGHPVFPVTRDVDVTALASRVTGPALTLITVREDDLADVLGELPAPLRSSVGLVQNDLVPDDWQRHNLEPTIAVVWFEKKPGRPRKVIRPTIVGGPAASIVIDALSSIDVPAIGVEGDGLINALVAKNLYIGVSNIGGLALPPGSTVDELWNKHRELAMEVADQVLDVQEVLTALPLDRRALVADMAGSFDADPDHVAMGRSAPQRLQRALEVARSHGIEAPALRRIEAAV